MASSLINKLLVWMARTLGISPGLAHVFLLFLVTVGFGAFEYEAFSSFHSPVFVSFWVGVCALVIVVTWLTQGELRRTWWQAKSRISLRPEPIQRDAYSKMDLNRIGDQNYISELRTEMNEQEADLQYLSGRINLMERLASEWGEEDVPRPSGLSDLSVNEFVAIALALNRNEFKNPTGQFLSIRPWQQAWVLRQWKMEKYIGRRIGVTD